LYFLHFLGKDELFQVERMHFMLLLPVNVKSTLSLNFKKNEENLLEHACRLSDEHCICTVQPYFTG
jgi:hypothetical protein